MPLERPLTYRVPESLRGRAAPGMRALVPVQKRIETGYIVGFEQESPVEKTRALIDLPDEEPVFSREILDLCRWLSDYYCCSWGEALQSAVPAGIRVRSKMRYTLVLEQLSAGRYTDRQRAVVGELNRSGPLTEAQLAKAVGAAALSNTLQTLVKRGILLAEPVTEAASVRMRTETFARLIEENIPDAETLEQLQRRAPKQAAVYLDLLHGEPERPAPLLYEKHQANMGILRALESREYIRIEEREHYRIPEFQTSSHAGCKLELNDDQQAAYNTIVEAMELGAFQTFLLQGITGSGKTEVYLQVIERALALGRSAIILVPEISLTPQTVGRFKARFDTDIAVLHSGLGAGERYDEWRRAKRGEVRIVVGARSAVFAPLPNLGVLIVDEEHDGSYKQSETPRYHARDVAIMRAKMNGAVCVLGSATPSIESYHNSVAGKSKRILLPRRATNASLPEVELLDMRQEVRETGNATFLSRRLEAEVKVRVEAGGQVLLLLNRRGFAPFVMCPSCGWVAYCNDCQVTMTYHAKGGYLQCHYCNAQREVPQVCDECYFNPLLFLGVGTQKVEDLLVRSFPDARVERMDADTTSGKGGHAKILGRLAAREIDILVGTQMIAKGHDYPGVTLVGIINADAGLALPDFRAAEGAFQLLTQVAGRAGRGETPGKVVLQTHFPDHYAVQFAARHDYGSFAEKELRFRGWMHYPPFDSLANIVVRSDKQEEALRYSGLLGRWFESVRHEGVRVLGPAPAPIVRLKKDYRFHFVLKAGSRERLNYVLRAMLATAQRQKIPRTNIIVDVDAMSLS